MVITFDIVGYQAFDEFMSNFNSDNKLVHIFFCGSKYPNGKSWCEDCNIVSNLIRSILQHCDPESYLINVQVGDHLAWRDPDNPFRKDPRTSLATIPTIIRWKLPQRLEGDYCLNVEVLKLLFTGEE